MRYAPGETREDLITETLHSTAGTDANVGAVLLVLQESGSTSHVLPGEGAVIIGRSTECDIPISDAKLSRKHLRLTLGSRLEVTDLGSMNGTTVRGVPLEPHEPRTIEPGDPIGLGSAMLVVQRSKTLARPRRVWSHDYFEARLEDECARASDHGGSFAVVRVKLKATETNGTFEEELTQWFRPSDTLGKYGPDEYEILRVNVDQIDTARAVHDLRARLNGLGIDCLVGVAIYPQDGRTPEALIEHAGQKGIDDAPAPALHAAVVAAGFMDRVRPMVERIAQTMINVLVLGETGVGKEVMARRIHELSPRADSPLVSINCAALTESLLESELFGHERGAFTGAVQAKAGLLESANGGTVFLDEVGEMTLTLQAKLLRVLEQREIARVGGLKVRPIDVRFVAATNRDLEEESARGRFRQDLYFRLNGVSITIPPLRERRDEIERLAHAFIEDACRRMKRSTLKLGRDTLAVFAKYDWPGNIRELRNVVESAVALTTGGTIGPEHLPLEKMGRVLASRPPSTRPPAYAPAQRISSDSNLRPTLGPLSGLYSDQSEAPTASHTALPPGALAPALDERSRILNALQQCAGNQTQAAKLLGMSRGTLITRLQAYGLPRPRKRDG